jgi:hypothetical protein
MLFLRSAENGSAESQALYNFIVMIQGSIVELFCIYKRDGGDG